MLQRLPIAVAQVQTGIKPENLVNEIQQILYFLYRVKQYNNIINSIRA